MLNFVFLRRWSGQDDITKYLGLACSEQPRPPWQHRPVPWSPPPGRWCRRAPGWRRGTSCPDKHNVSLERENPGVSWSPQPGRLYSRRLRCRRSPPGKSRQTSSDRQLGKFRDVFPQTPETRTRLRPLLLLLVCTGPLSHALPIHICGICMFQLHHHQIAQ